MRRSELSSISSPARGGGRVTVVEKATHGASDAVTPAIATHDRVNFIELRTPA
jgi:tRNA(Phe) wybutosine-synthesizing methylase Tyw3